MFYLAVSLIEHGSTRGAKGIICGAVLICETLVASLGGLKTRHYDKAFDTNKCAKETKSL